MSEYLDAWKVSEKDFPHKGTEAEKLAFCVRYAALAPSTYNSQPWFFHIDGYELLLYIDRRHALPVIDPDDRQQMLACASALYALRLAIRHFGYAEVTSFFPEGKQSDLLARITIGEKTVIPPPEHDVQLFRAIPKRHTNRGAFADKDVPSEGLQALKTAAFKEDAWLHICKTTERKSILRLIAEADHIQSGNRHFRRELASWTDPRRQASGDGMPGYNLTNAQVLDSLSPSVVRRFENGNGGVATDVQLDEGSPVLAILGTKAGGALERLHAGQAMMRILLQAECEGLAVSTLNQPCEIPELRLRLQDEIEQNGRVHAVFRIGYGGKPIYTPRRPLSTVVRVEGGHVFPETDRRAANQKRKNFFKKLGRLFKR